MDEGLQEPLKKTRLLAWLTAGLLAAGVVSAGAVTARNDAAGRRIVTAAGQGADGVELPDTVADFVPPAPPPPPPAPPTTAAPAPTTTAATRPTLSPTTQAARPTTTTASRAASTTSTTMAGAVPAGVLPTVQNGHPMAVVVKVNHRTFTLAPNERVGPVPVNRYAHGNDIVEVSLSQHPQCGMGDADSYFPAPGSYELVVAPPPVASGCAAGVPGVGFVVLKG